MSDDSFGSCLDRLWTGTPLSEDDQHVLEADAVVAYEARLQRARAGTGFVAGLLAVVIWLVIAGGGV